MTSELIDRGGRIVKSADISQVLFSMTNSPVVQNREWSPFTPYDWQQAIWVACWGSGRQVAVRTANESGKTSCVVPILALSWAAAFPGSQVAVTSFSERQLEKQLMPSIKNMIYGHSGWRSSGNTIYAPSQDGLPPSEVVCFATRSGNAFEGFHNRVHFDHNKVERYCPLLIIADEAKSIKSDIFDAIERCNPTSELRISTCGEDSGGFYDACVNKSGLWKTSYEWKGRKIAFKVPWTECPHLTDGHSYSRKMAMLEEKGPNDPIVRSILLAEFFRSGDHMVFNDADILAIQECQSGFVEHLPGQRRGFCDLSGGGDERTFGFRNGNRVYPLITRSGDTRTPPSDIASWYIGLFKDHGLDAKDIFCDNGGLGAEIIKEMEKRGWPVRKVNFGAGAIDSGTYTTRMTELHWEFKSMCHNRSIILPDDDRLMEQMRLRRYTMRNTDDNRLSLEAKAKAKDRGDHSPDRLETIIGLFIDSERFENPRLSYQKTNVSLCGTPAEYMKRALQDVSELGDGFGGGWEGA